MGERLDGIIGSAGDGADGDGIAAALTVAATIVEPGQGGPPLHVHPSLDATFSVLEGRLTFNIGGVLVTALAGASVSARRGVPHTYANDSGRPARFLAAWVPRVSAPHECRIVPGNA